MEVRQAVTSELARICSLVEGIPGRSNDVNEATYFRLDPLPITSNSGSQNRQSDKLLVLHQL